MSTGKLISLTESALEPLGIGVLIVHGRTIVRASQAASALLTGERALIGNDLAHYLAKPDQARLKSWMKRHYEDERASDTLQVTLAGDNARNLQLSCWRGEDNTAHTRTLLLMPGTQQQQPASGIAELRRTLDELLNGNPIPTFVIGTDHRVMYWNRACEAVLGLSASEMLGSQNHWRAFHTEKHPLLADLVVDGLCAEDAINKFGTTVRPSAILPEALETTGFFPVDSPRGRWLLKTAAPIRSTTGELIGAIQTVVDITEIKRAEHALRATQAALEDTVRQRTAQLETAKQALEADITRREEAERELLSRYSELTALNVELIEAKEQIEAAQNQLVQSEKLASIGQLAAGVAHEINNPIGYVFSNFGSLENYLADMLKLIETYQAAEPAVGDTALRDRLVQLRESLDLDFLREDTLALMRESREGIERVRKIVQDLKDFSRVDTDLDWQSADILRGLESTLNIAHNEIKYHAEVVREFAPLPLVQCLPSQLNQVFMNMVVNAAHAMEGQKQGRITVRTEDLGEQICVSFADTGCGMSEEVIKKIFDPFFTTKPIGKGTGLGLSLSYGIIHKHHGRIDVDSTPGVGTTFRIFLPVRQTEADREAA